MLHIVDNLCARLRTVHDVAGMQEALSEVAKVIELPHYAYIGYPDSAELAPLVIETYPDGWAKRYVEQRYDLLDPIVHRSKGSLVPFEWSCHEEMKTANRSQRRFLREAIRYGIVSG